jgi:hypothetical protein
MNDQETKPNQDKPVPVAIQRLLDEVRNERESPSPLDYNRMHNRHNRS